MGYSMLRYRHVWAQLFVPGHGSEGEVEQEEAQGRVQAALSMAWSWRTQPPASGAEVGRMGMARL